LFTHRVRAFVYGDDEIKIGLCALKLFIFGTSFPVSASKMAGDCRRKRPLLEKDGTQM
jgi:hypothetical protein